ncbi:MAG: Nramp family divalent metal transporter [Candidatus Velthaea sp.]
MSRATIGAAGAAFAVGIGYMDPGNWATDLNATRYGVTLLWAVVFSGAAAMLLQVLVVKYTAATGYDLAQAIARRWPRQAPFLWPFYGFAIVATEMAEFTGVVVGIELLTNAPAAAAVALGVACFAILYVSGATGARRIEVIAVVTTAILALTYALECFRLQPPMGPILAGIRPMLAGPGAALAVVGIIGATIMPHNLFLHGGLVVRRFRTSPPRDHRRIERAAIRDTLLVLALATAINAAILIVGNSVHAATIEAAFVALQPLLGSGAAALFGFALVAAGLAATASGACAGDLVCNREMPLRLSPLARRICSVGPAAIALAAGVAPTFLLLASQIALGLLLPLVVVPLLWLVASAAVARTRGGLLLVASSSVVALAALVCDGVLLTSVFGHA